MDGTAAGAAGEYLTFRIDREEYAIEIGQVREIREHQEPTRIVDAPSFMTGVINLRGTIVPILDLRARLGFERMLVVADLARLLAPAEGAVA